jgi:DNA invertase Pin-like site-specific DNA recombinase
MAKASGKTVALYLRVSTGEQNVENQRRELTAAVERRGWRLVAEFVDDGISGAKGRDKRPAFDRLLKAIVRHEFAIVAAWSVDRLGRSLQDLVSFLGEVHGAGVDLFLDRQGVDTSTPAGKALFQLLGVFAEFERSIIQERIRAGIARARQKGTRSGKPFGRPRIPAKKEAAVRALLVAGNGIRKAARLAGVGNETAGAGVQVAPAGRARGYRGAGRLGAALLRGGRDRSGGPVIAGAGLSREADRRGWGVASPAT